MEKVKRITRNGAALAALNLDLAAGRREAPVAVAAMGSQDYILQLATLLLSRSYFSHAGCPILALSGG
jgi:hypothetical protein